MSAISAHTLIDLAIDLTQNLTKEDRFQRLLTTVRQMIPCDAVAILILRGDSLLPVAQQGLSSDCMGRRFVIAEHPRLQHICRTTAPVRFATDSPLPDPYDGMLANTDEPLKVHACMGMQLTIENELMGVLTLDSMDAEVFQDIPDRTLEIVSALSAASLQTALLLQQLEEKSKHNREVVEELSREPLTKEGGELIGTSHGMETLKRDIALVAPSDFSVLIQGETGVGKELVARSIHLDSSRAQGPMVYLNCAAISENLIESELFGHVKGAFTGADRNRSGKFALANGGTLFLDEVGELPLAAQSKLLRALQNQEIQPVGQDTVQQVDVRILAATNRNLATEVKEGRFRADLYHRLRVYPIVVPPLRKRREDIAPLAGHFAEKTRRKLGIRQLVIAPPVLKQLDQYQWPGNIRELEHIISRAALRAAGGSASDIVQIQMHHLERLEGEPAPTPEQPLPKAVANTNLKQATEDFQRQLITNTLSGCAGRWAKAASTLGMDRSNLSRLAKRLGIKVSRQVHTD